MKDGMERLGSAFLIAGMLLIAVSLGVFARNNYVSGRADQEANATVAAMKSILEEGAAGKAGNGLGEESGGPDSGDGVKQALSFGGEEATENCFFVDGRAYLGLILIPSVDLELPVSEELSDEALKAYPCRYYGSAEQGDLVIAGHNYKSGFGKLSRVKRGDLISLVDAAGQIYQYSVEEIEILEAQDVDLMIRSDWDLSMYTCTYGGKQRFTVRCKKITEMAYGK